MNVALIIQPSDKYTAPRRLSLFEPQNRPSPHPPGGIIMDTPMRTKTHRKTGIVARYPVTVFTADGFLEGVTQLINNRGALIRCRRPPRQHETATIRIQLSKRESLLVEAEVMMLHFSEPNENQEVVPLGMVVRFKNLSSISRKRLRRVIAKHYAKKVQRMTERN